MSTELITYLNYIATWSTQSDDNINSILTEHTLFVGIGTYDSDSAVDNEFNTLTDLAQTVCDETVTADSIQIAADAAALASFWSFGISMAVFFGLEATEQALKADISSKASELNSKLATVDIDIAAKVNNNVNLYVTQFKADNTLIASIAVAGLDTRTCRSYLMQFLAQVQKFNGTVDLAGFKKYAQVAEMLFNCPEIQAVYNALDTLELSSQTDADIQQCMNVIKNLNIDPTWIQLVQGTAFSIMSYKMKIANDRIAKIAKEAGIEELDINASTWELLDSVGKFALIVTAIMSVVDIVMQILGIVDVVEQTHQFLDQLNGTIRPSYKSFFEGIQSASQAYNAAVAGTSSAKTK